MGVHKGDRQGESAYMDFEGLGPDDLERPTFDQELPKQGCCQWCWNLTTNIGPEGRHECVPCGTLRYNVIHKTKAVKLMMKLLKKGELHLGNLR